MLAGQRSAASHRRRTSAAAGPAVVSVNTRGTTQACTAPLTLIGTSFNLENLANGREFALTSKGLPDQRLEISRLKA